MTQPPKGRPRQISELSSYDTMSREDITEKNHPKWLSDPHQQA